jgi:hypothetical protein
MLVTGWLMNTKPLRILHVILARHAAERHAVACLCYPDGPSDVRQLGRTAYGGKVVRGTCQFAGSER